MTDLTALQKEIREINEANGWFDTERPFSADIALLHSEVSEFFETIIGIFDNSAEELADILIRLLDTAERGGFDVTLDVKRDPILTTSPQALHLLVSRAYEGYRNGDREAIELNLNRVRIMTFDAAGILGGEARLLAEVDKKLAKNRERGYRHGGKKE